MSTANKLTYLNVTKQKLKQAINNIGGEVTDETTFRNYVAELENAYDRLPKTEFEEGTEITLENTLKGKLDYAKEYQEVEYIESTGTQYIDTGVLPNSSQKIEMKLAWLNSDNVVAFGSRTSGAYNTSTDQLYFNYNLNLSSKAIFIEGPYLGDPRDEIGDDVVIGTPQIYVLNANKYQLSTTSQNYYLFGFNNQGVAIGNTQMKLYYCKIYNGETLVRDFIPCYRKSDNVIGLYDKVNGVFYTNAGTGTFTKGADVGNGFGDIVGIGQAEQESTQGYNLYPPVLTGMSTYYCVPKVVGDEITLLSQHDGEIYYGGVANAGSGYVTALGPKIPVKPSTTYRISSSSQEVSRFFITKFDTNNISLGFVQANPTFTTDANTSYITLRVGVPSSDVINNHSYTAKIWLYEGSTEKTYEKYSGGYSSPSPNWKQEIKYVRGKNLFNKATVTQRSYIDAQGVLKGADGTYCASDYIEVYQGSIVWSATTGNGYSLSIYDSSKTFIRSVGRTGNNAMVIPIANGEKYIRFTLLTADLDITQIEEGTQATPYLPYNTIEEVVSGINYANYSLLFNNTDCYSISNDNISLLQNDSRATTLIDGTTWGISLKKGTYTLYTSGTGISPQIQIIGKVIGQIARVNYSQLVTFNLSQDDIVAIKYLNTASFPINLGKVMIIEGTIANTPTYEPYITPTSYQLSLGDIQLNAIGNYKDELIYDVDEDKVYKNEKIHRYEFTGQENFSKSGEYGGGYSFFLMWSNTLLGGVENAPFKCNMGSYVSAIADYGIGKIFSDRGMAMNLYSTTEVVTADDFKAKLKDLYDNGTPCYIVHQKATPELIPITNTTLINQVKALYNAHSLNGTTIITSNGNLPMIIKVRGLKGE